MKMNEFSSIFLALITLASTTQAFGGQLIEVYPERLAVNLVTGKLPPALDVYDGYGVKIKTYLVEDNSQFTYPAQAECEFVRQKAIADNKMLLINPSENIYAQTIDLVVNNLCVESTNDRKY